MGVHSEKLAISAAENPSIDKEYKNKNIKTTGIGKKADPNYKKHTQIMHSVYCFAENVSGNFN